MSVCPRINPDPLDFELLDSLRDLGSLHLLLSVALMKSHDQKQLQEERVCSAYSSGGLKSIRMGKVRHVSRSRKLTAHIFLCAGSKGRVRT